jgi:two-component system cell cycle sensor histidine kinase/response regulator CckA
VRRALLWLLTAAVYLAARRIAMRWTFAESGAAVWPGLGIVYSAAVLGGPWLATATAVAAFADSLTRGMSLGIAAGLGLATLAASAAAIVVDRAGRTDGSGERVSAFVARFTGASAAALVVSVGSALTFALAGGLTGSAVHDVGFWFLGGLTGIVVVSPFLRSWIHRAPPGAASLVEIAAILLLAAGLAELVCLSALGRVGSPAYALLPVVFWASIRAGRRATTSVILIVALISLVNTNAGRGPFVARDPTDSALSLMAFLLVVSLSGLAFASLAWARDQAEARLRESEERFRALIENSTDLIAVLEPDGRILYESPASLAILGYRPEELVGRDAFDLIHPDDRNAARGAFESVLAEPGTTVVAGARVRHASGRWVDLVATASNLVDEPTVGGVVVNSRDVTASRRAERELAEAEQRYRVLVEGLPLVTYVRGSVEDQPPLYVSPQIEELLGYPVSAWYDDARFAERVVHPDDAAVPVGVLAEEGEDATRAEYRMIAADGRVVWVLDRMVTVRDDQGGRAAVHGFLVDITERKRLEEQLRCAQRMESLGLLAGGVAHDFNNLLTAIAGYGELARSNLDDPERTATNLDEVLSATRRASSLTRQLLAFGRRQVLDCDILDPNEVVQATRPLLARLLGDGVQLVCRCQPGVGAVRADGGQLEQVLVNLALNARDAMPGGGRLTIATRDETAIDPGEGVPPGDYVVVSVADTGVGIEESVRDRMFDPFFTTKDVGAGTGLGLAVVYGIVDQSGGRVVVRTRPGEGTEFRIMLPRSEERPEPRVSLGTSAPGGSETVLLVEDETIVRRLTVEMLERQGYRVVAAASPAAALRVEESYDLLLTDVVMPGMSGPELAERLTVGRPELAVLFTSGYSAPAVADPATLAGDLLEKPFTLEQLAAKVRHALDARVAADVA